MKRSQFSIIALISLVLLWTPGSVHGRQKLETSTERVIHRTSEVKTRGSFQSLDVKSRGKITLFGSDEDIRSISPGGYIKIRKTTFGNKKEVLIESDESGVLTRYYYDNRVETPYEPDGRRWLGSILVDVVRTSGIAAEDRVNRIYSEQGVEGVLDEIEEISSNSVKGRYFGLLLQKNGLSGGELAEIAQEVSDEISSSSQQGSIYRKYSHKFLASEESAEEYFRGVGRISSSSEQGYTLRKVLKDEDLSVDMKAELLKTSERITSSSERGAVMRAFNEVYEEDEQVINAYYDAVKGITSSSEQGSVLRNLLKHQSLSAESLEELFETVDGITSSSEQGSVLRASVSQVEGNESSLETYFSTVGHMSSSSEMGSVLRSVLEQAELTPELMNGLFEAVDRISSSSEKGSVMRRAVPFINNDREAVSGFVSVVEGISSSNEQGYVLRELVRKGNPDDNTLIAVLESSEEIVSSSTRVELMLAVAEEMGEDSDRVRDVYKEVAKSIESTSGYRTVMERVF